MCDRDVVDRLAANDLEREIVAATDDEPEFQRGDHVRSATHGGVAFWYLGRCVDPLRPHDEGCRLLMMVGDDHEWHIDVSDITPLDEDDFCGGCGQVGCGHG